MANCYRPAVHLFEEVRAMLFKQRDDFMGSLKDVVYRTFGRSYGYHDHLYETANQAGQCLTVLPPHVVRGAGKF
jgi:hypothetical protein